MQSLSFSLQTILDPAADRVNGESSPAHQGSLRLQHLVDDAGGSYTLAGVIPRTTA